MLLARFLAVSVGYWAVTSLGRVLPRRRIPCQRESWLDDSTLSVMHIHIFSQGNYITVLDAISGCNPNLGWEQSGGFWKDAGEAPGRTLSRVPSVREDARAGTGPAPAGI